MTLKSRRLDADINNAHINVKRLFFRISQTTIKDCISITKQQFVITHMIGQIEIPTSLDSGVTNTTTKILYFVDRASCNDSR